MGYDKSPSRRPVNMTLNEDLLRRARGFAPDLSETVETLLAAFVDAAEAREAAGRVAAHIAASEAFVAAHGSLADEFSAL